jgi:hypothetical protein
LKLSKTFIKRRYFDMRTGNTTISPVLQLSNFLMLSYLTINDIIPIWLFAPFFIVGIISAFTLIGNRFRKVQTTTDINMNYEKASEALRTTVVCMELTIDMAKKLGIEPAKEYLDRLEYSRSIAENKL